MASQTTPKIDWSMLAGFLLFFTLLVYGIYGVVKDHIGNSDFVSWCAEHEGNRTTCEEYTRCVESFYPVSESGWSRLLPDDVHQMVEEDPDMSQADAIRVHCLEQARQEDA